MRLIRIILDIFDLEVMGGHMASYLANFSLKIYYFDPQARKKGNIFDVK